MATMVTMCSVINSYSRWKSESAYGAQANQITLAHHPIFVIGHWRTGTTFLHELMVQDAQFNFPNTYQCMAPHHFLRTERVLTACTSRLLPRQRVMDNMDFSWNLPQEDEFALCNLGLPSPYLYWAFPDCHDEARDALSLDTLSPDEQQRWTAGLNWFLKRLTFNDGRQLILKSPPHTARIRLILNLYPKARFIHLVRHPVAMIPSTIRTWRQMGKSCELHHRQDENLEDIAYENLHEMYRVYWRDEGLLCADQWCQVRYEDLTADPIGQVERIYQSLQLDGFNTARRQFEAHLSQKTGYRKNRFDVNSEFHDRIQQNCQDYALRYDYVQSEQPRPPKSKLPLSSARR